ncbi:DUF1810 domain-containing protein [Devosia nitrariae]|uniref:DUF1810 domain-containing protein n=1 Tax=Devosia nitrariae TaxID=2071872 RepID=A0ABQ5W7H3_9HYPH|nr:DUF1810 domain-containing protein [Devosia nitrariae]GLQ56045.1 hypothetical protein GCM10010862_33040 [Devosia nitrariae]
MFSHFLDAQDPIYPTVLAELRAGRKRTHWMWFVFPQVAGLGFSEMSRRFALAGIEEARAYLEHKVLGARLVECTQAVLAYAPGVDGRGKSVHEIFGSPDDRKFFSSMTLFAHATETLPSVWPFRAALDAFFEGKEDEETLRRI